MTSSPSKLPSCMVPKTQQLVIQAFLACQLVQTFLADPKDPPHVDHDAFREFVVGFIVAMQKDIWGLTHRAREPSVPYYHIIKVAEELVSSVLALCPGVPSAYIPSGRFSRDWFMLNFIQMADGNGSRAGIEGFRAGLQLTYYGLDTRFGLPIIHEHPHLLTLTDASTLRFYENDSPVTPESKPFISGATIELVDGGYIACCVTTAPRRCGGRINNVYRVTFEMNDRILGTMAMFVKFGAIGCHRVYFGRSGYSPFACEVYDWDALITPFGVIDFDACMEILQDIASQLRADPGSRLSAGEGKLSMLTSRDKELWAITATVDTKCDCMYAKMRTLDFASLYLDGVVIACAGSEQVSTAQEVALRSSVDHHKPLVEDDRITVFQQRQKEWAALRWSPLRVAWIGAVVRSASARVRAGAL